MKIKRKNRIISAILAVAMTASLVPTGVISAYAVTEIGVNTFPAYENSSITKNDDGTFTVEFTFEDEKSNGLNNWAMALVPDLSKLDAGSVPSENIGLDISVDMSGYESFRSAITGLGAPDPEDYDIKSGNSESFDATGKVSATFSLGEWKDAWNKLKDRGYVRSNGDPFESVTNIPLVGIFWKDNLPVKVASTEVFTWTAGGILVEPDPITISYKYDPDDETVGAGSYSTSNGKGSWTGTADGQATIVYTITNANGGPVTITGIDLSGSSTATSASGEAITDYWSATYKDESGKDISDSYEIPANGIITMTVEYNETSGMLPEIFLGEGQLIISWQDEAGNENGNLEPGYANFVFSTTSTKWEKEKDIDFIIPEIYIPDNLPQKDRQIILTWYDEDPDGSTTFDPNATVNQTLQNGGVLRGGKIEYFKLDGTKISNPIPLKNGDQIRIRYTPPTGLTPTSTIPDDAAVQVTAGTSSILVGVKVSVEKAQRRTITGAVTSGQETWGTVAATSSNSGATYTPTTGVTDATTTSVVVGNLLKDDIVTLTPTPANKGYRFVKWVEDNSTANPRGVTVGSTDATYTAEFAENPIDLGLDTSENINYGSAITSKTISVTDASYSAGDSITYTVESKSAAFDTYFDVTITNGDGNPAPAGTGKGSVVISNKAGKKAPAGTYKITVKGVSGFNSTEDTTTHTITVGENDASLSGSPTFEKNNAAVTTAAPSYTIGLGGWDHVSTVSVEGTAIPAKTASAAGWSVSGTTLTIDNAALDSLDLTNGDHTNKVSVTFVDAANGNPTTKTATLKVKTTYVVNFKNHDGTAVSTNIANKATTDTTVPTFAYGNIKNAPTRAGYTLAGWATTQGATTATWTSASANYQPATDVTTKAAWNSTVYAVWTPVGPDLTPNPMVKTVGDDCTGSKAHEVGVVTVTGLPGATYTITPGSVTGLPAGLTLKLDSSVNGRVIIEGTPTAATTGAVTVTFEVGVSNTAKKTFEVKVTINKKTLIDPTLTHVQDLTMAGANNGKLTFALPSGDDAWPAGAVETTYKLQKSTSQNGKYTDVKTVSPGTITDLAPGWYKVVATLKDSANYAWAAGNDGVTQSVEIKDKGTNNPTVSQVQTFERNGTVRTATSVSFKYTTGDWTRVTGVEVDGKSVAFSDNGTDTVTILCTDLDGLSLTNGTKSVELTFARDSVEPLTKTASDDLLNVQTTYKVIFDKNAPSGATAPTANPSIAKQTVYGSTAPDFAYGSISNNFNNNSIPGYSFLGWDTKADGTGTDWVAGVDYTPAVTDYESTVYAQWKANAPTVTTHDVTGTYGSDQLTANGVTSASPTVAAVVTSGKIGDTYDYALKADSDAVPAGLTISWGGKTTPGTSGSYESGTGTVTISGKPREVNPGAAVKIKFTATSKTNGESVDGEFTIEIAKATPTIRVGYQTTSLKDPATGANYTVTKSKTNTFVGDLTDKTATVTVVSGPYWDGGNWVTLGRDTPGMSWTLAPATLDNPSNTVTGTLTYNPGTAVTLTDFWTTDKGTGTIEATATYEVTVQVRHNGSTTSTGSGGNLGANLRDGAAVLFTKSGYSSDSGGVTYAISSTGHNVKVKVPSGTGYTVAVGSDQRTGISVSENTTIYFDYYDVNYATRSMSNDHGEYGTSSSHSSTATSGLVLVGANTASATKNWVKLPDTVADTNYKLNTWTSSGTGTFKSTADGSGTSNLTGTNTASAKSWVVGNHTGTGAITMTPSFTPTGVNTTVTVRVDGSTDTTGKAGVAKIELWTSGATAANYTSNVTSGVASFTNITAGTYSIYVNYGATAVDSNVDVTFSDTTKNAYVDYYTVNYTTPATQVHFQGNNVWDKLGGAKAVTAEVGGASIATGTAVLKGTEVTFKVADWSADYALTWSHTLTGADGKNNNGKLTAGANVFPSTNPVAATLTQRTHTISGTTERTNNTGNYSDIQNVYYTAAGVTGGALRVTNYSATGTFSLAVPAGFTYTLSAQSKNVDSTQITGYKVGGTAAKPADFTVSATDADNKALTIVIVGSKFSFKLVHWNEDPAAEVDGNTWTPVTFGYTQADAPAKTVTIVNTGNRPLTNVSFTATGSGFTSAASITVTYPDGGSEIPVGGKATFEVTPELYKNVAGSIYKQTYTVTADKVATADQKTYLAQMEVQKAPMDYATLELDPPSKGATPASTAKKTDTDYNSYYSTAVTWKTEAGGNVPSFVTGTTYVATIVLTPDNDHKFVNEHGAGHADKFYTVNTAKTGETGTYGGRLESHTVNADGSVTLVYKFQPLAAGQPTPTIVPVDYKQGKVTGMKVESGGQVKFYYVVVPALTSGETAPTAQEIYNAATGAGTVPKQIIYGVETSTAAPDGNGEVSWTGSRPFNGDPGASYTVFVTSQAANGTGNLSPVGRASATLPKLLTVNITKAGAGASATTVKGKYSTVNASGSEVDANLNLSGTTPNSGELSVTKATEAPHFTAAPGLMSNETDNPAPWALKSWRVRRADTKDGIAAATGTTNDSATIPYLYAAPVTQIDVTFRQRIINRPVITETPTIGTTLTARVGTGTSQVKIGDTNVDTFGPTSNFKDTLTYQWQWNDGGTWKDIADANEYQWTVTADHSGHSFRVVVTYTGDNTYNATGEGQPSVVTSLPTTAQTQTLAQPVIHLYKVENNGTDNAGGAITAPADLNLGGLYLVVEPVDHESDAGATYEVTLTGGPLGTANAIKVTIDPDAPDVQKVGNNYWLRWPANWDNVRPGNNGTSNNTFKASVRAVVPADTTGWASSTAKEDTSPAGRRPLNQTDLTGTFNDRIFNGAPQTGYGDTGATTTSNPINGQIKTIAGLFQRDKVGAVGDISIQYANDAAGNTKADTKTNVNMTEAVTTADTPPVEDWEPANKHDYYSYVSVAQGGLYLKLAQFAFNQNGQDGDWKITQAPTQIQGLQNKTTEQNVAVDLTTSNPRVRYQAANGTWVGNYPGQSGTEYVTSQFDFTYAVTGWSGGTPVAGTDYDLVDTTFTPKSTGTFTITVTAKYKSGIAPQFKADLAEPPTATFTVGGQMGDFKGLQVEAVTREAIYGDAASAVSNPTTTAIWYVTADTNGDPDNNQAKYFSLEGIKVTETWSNGNQNYDLSTLKPENIKDLSAGAKAEKGADGILRIKFDNANGSQRKVTFKVTNTHPSGATGKDVTYTSTNTVTLILKARPLPYKIQATNSTETDPGVIDWTVKAEKLWNNDVTLNPGGDKARDGTPLRLQTVVDDPFAQKDNVVINPNGYKSRNPANTADDSTAGQDRVVVAKNAQPSGGLAKFYRTGDATNGHIDIYPAHINPMEVEIDKPSTITVGDANLKSKVGVRVKQKNDESNKGGGDIRFAPGTAIKWEKWNTTTSQWEEDNTPIFQIDSLYRATVVLKADGNHYFHQGEDDKFYNVNGLYNGDFSYLDPEWKKEASKVIVDVDEDGPMHAGLNVLYNNEVTISYVFDTSETPELRYSDGIGANNDADYHHQPNKYVTHTEDVTIGDVTSDLVYTINLDAFTRPIFGVTVAITDNDLTSKDGVTLVPTRPKDDPSTSRTEMKLEGYKADPDKPGDRDYDMDLDRISYTLTIPRELANTKGTYTLTLQARGASSQANVEANRYDVADNRYTFVLVVREKQQQVVSGGGGGPETPVVKYWVSDYGYTDDLTAEKMPRVGAKPTFLPRITAMPGLKFLGWSETDPTKLEAGKLPTLVDPLTFTINEDKVFYAVYERVADSHSHYVIGFPDGTFGPDDRITRGQVATIIARSCLENFAEGSDYGNPGNYSDVTEHWAYSAISYCSLNGVFTGYEDDTFRPDRYITRQELATVVARLAGVQVNQGLNFIDSGDVANWAQNGVYTNVANGWVNGYEDNTFRPLNDITRAETVKIFNGYLKRGVDAEGLSDLTEFVHSGVASNNTSGNGENKEYMTWPDVAKSHWAYYEIIEAANDHVYHWPGETTTPPEHWDEAYIDDAWRYYDNENDGGDNVGQEAQRFTVTYVVNGEVVNVETVKIFESPSVEGLPVLTPPEGYYLAGWALKDPAANEIGEEDLFDPTANYVDGDRTYYAVFWQIPEYVMPTFTVTYVIGENGATDAAALTETVTMYESPSVAALPKVTGRNGYRFAGWSEKNPALYEITEADLMDPTAFPVLEDKTFYAVYATGNEFLKPVETTVTVTYVIGENGVTDAALTETVPMYESPTVAGLPVVRANEGYRFAGWTEKDPSANEITEADLLDPTAAPVTEDKTFYAVYAPAEPGQEGEQPVQEDLVTVTYVASGNGMTWDPITDTVERNSSISPDRMPIARPNEGYTFLGWSETDPATGTITLVDPTAMILTEDKTFYGVFQAVTVEVTTVTVTYVTGENGSTGDAITETVAQAGAPAAIPSVTANEGYRFAGWSETDPATGTVTKVDLSALSLTEDRTFYAVYEIDQSVEPVDYDRYRYINGFEDGTFRPDDVITRSAVANIIAKLAGYNANETYDAGAFTDLENHWARNVIAYCVQEGVMSGYEDGTFRPDRSISRQELAVVMARLSGEVLTNEGLPFTDSGDIAAWALDGVYTAYAKGWMNGYEDGSFLPERQVSRAEAVKLFNAYLGRAADPAYIQGQTGYNTWGDVADTHWAYYEVIEASNNWLEPIPQGETQPEAEPVEEPEPEPVQEPEPVEEPEPDQETQPVEEPQPDQEPEPEQGSDQEPEQEPDQGSDQETDQGSDQETDQGSDQETDQGSDQESGPDQGQ